MEGIPITDKRNRRKVLEGKQVLFFKFVLGFCDYNEIAEANKSN